ncbi:MAG: TMEM175 family protein [Parafilimonas sp.]
MMRKTIAKKIQISNKQFRLRGHEVKRIEAFSDAVFAFAVTLLIVSLEVPKTFEELMVTMKGFFAFGISFLFLMLIWYEQNMFFRRFALDDKTTIFLNSALMFIVLFYVYPLKFLFTLMFNSVSAMVQIEQRQVPSLMYIYSAGYIIIYLLFFFMYLHACRKKDELELTAIELHDTKTRMWAQLILVMIGLLCVFTVSILPVERAGSAGFVFFLIGPVFSIYFSVRGKKRRKMQKEIAE